MLEAIVTHEAPVRLANVCGMFIGICLTTNTNRVGREDHMVSLSKISIKSIN